MERRGKALLVSSLTHDTVRLSTVHCRRRRRQNCVCPTRPFHVTSQCTRKFHFPASLGPSAHWHRSERLHRTSTVATDRGRGRGGAGWSRRARRSLPEASDVHRVDRTSRRAARSVSLWLPSASDHRLESRAETALSLAGVQDRWYHAGTCRAPRG